MIAHDDELFDSIAALALGVLGPAEAEPLAKHVRLCADCRMLYASLRSTADLVGYSAEAVGERFDEVSRFRLKSRIMKSIRASETPHTIAPSTNGAPRPVAAHSPRTWIAYACAVAAIVIAALDTVANSSLRSDNERLTTVAQQQSGAAVRANARADNLGRRLAQIVTPGNKHYDVPGGEVVADGAQIVIALRNLPPLPPGKLYQAWTRKKGAKIMTPGQTFGPDASGLAVVAVPISAAGTVDAVAVSVEPASGSAAPTSTPTFFRVLG